MDIIKWYRRFKAVIWLTWKEESGWTKTPYYLGYVLTTPIFSLVIYAYLYIVIAFYSGLVNLELAYYLVTGISLYNFIGAGLYGIMWTIHSEREHFRTLKYTYIAFPDLQLYLMARSFYHYVVGFATSIVMLITGLLLTGVPLSRIAPDFLQLLALYIIGYIWSSQLGVMVAGTSIFSSEYGPLISEAVGGILFLLGAVLYPIESLPDFIEPFSEIFPMKEWIELMRHAVNTGYIVANIPNMYLTLIVKTSFYVIFSYIFFRITENLARKKGYLEATLHH